MGRETSGSAERRCRGVHAGADTRRRRPPLLAAVRSRGTRPRRRPRPGGRAGPPRTAQCPRASGEVEWCRALRESLVPLDEDLADVAPREALNMREALRTQFVLAHDRLADGTRNRLRALRVG